MSTAYELSGRTRQKQRTRDALVAAARELVASGVTPTIEDAASAAAISRTTAYRYFPNRHALLVAAHPEIGASSLLPVDPPMDPSSRLAAVISAFTQLILETEAQQRTMLRLSLEADPVERAALPLRQGRAIAWIEEAIAPLRGKLTDQALRQLVLAIRSAVGIEALAWLVDVAGLSREEAVGLMGWSAQALMHAALTWAPPPPGGSDSGPAEIQATIGQGPSRSRRRSPAGSASPVPIEQPVGSRGERARALRTES